MMTLHSSDAFIVYGTSSPPSSRLNDDHQTAAPEDIQISVKRWLVQQGQPLTQRVLTGMLHLFPEDCIPDASGVLLDAVGAAPGDRTWIGQDVFAGSQRTPSGHESGRKVITGSRARSSYG